MQNTKDWKGNGPHMPRIQEEQCWVGTVVLNNFALGLQLVPNGRFGQYHSNRWSVCLGVFWHLYSWMTFSQFHRPKCVWTIAGASNKWYIGFHTAYFRAGCNAWGLSGTQSCSPYHMRSLSQYLLSELRVCVYKPMPWNKHASTMHTTIWGQANLMRGSCVIYWW